MECSKLRTGAHKSKLHTGAGANRSTQGGQRRGARSARGQACARGPDSAFVADTRAQGQSLDRHHRRQPPKGPPWHCTCVSKKKLQQDAQKRKKLLLDRHQGREAPESSLWHCSAVPPESPNRVHPNGAVVHNWVHPRCTRFSATAPVFFRVPPVFWSVRHTEAC